MGKFMRKPNSTTDTAMDVSSPLGVRTRAKTLALQRLQSNLNYLQLRSRALQKLPLQKPPAEQTDKINPSPCSMLGYAIAPTTEVNQCCGRRTQVFEIVNSEIEASLGQNNVHSEVATESWTRENKISTTTPRGNIPTAHEMEEFFAYAERLLQHQFIDKYNFDIVNDLPLAGRYEWVHD